MCIVKVSSWFVSKCSKLFSICFAKLAVQFWLYLLLRVQLLPSAGCVSTLSVPFAGAAEPQGSSVRARARAAEAGGRGVRAARDSSGATSVPFLSPGWKLAKVLADWPADSSDFANPKWLPRMVINFECSLSSKVESWIFHYVLRDPGSGRPGAPVCMSRWRRNR